MSDRENVAHNATGRFLVAILDDGDGAPVTDTT
jgi:hypothetical protein